jgi:hypothetical protein
MRQWLVGSSMQNEYLRYTSTHIPVLQNTIYYLIRSAPIDCCLPIMLQKQVLNLDERHHFQTQTLFKKKPSDNHSLDNNHTMRFQNILDVIRPIQLQKLLEDFHGD